MSECIMKTYETKKQLYARLSGPRCTGRTIILVFTILLISAGSTICMVTHDPCYTKHAQHTIHLFDGRIVEDEIAEGIA
jgi:Ni2+-binding GTPase involved in maturation of urease and hydrogenase